MGNDLNTLLARQQKSKPRNPVKTIIVWVVVVILCLGAFIFFNLEGVPGGHKGFVIGKSNKLIKILDPGLHFVWPFGYHVRDVDLGMKKNSISWIVKTKDQIDVYVEIDIKREINSNYHKEYYEKYASSKSADRIYHDTSYIIGRAAERVFRNYDFNLLGDQQTREEIENEILKLVNEGFEYAMMIVDTKHEDAKIVEVLDKDEVNISKAIREDTRNIFGKMEKVYLLEKRSSSYEKFIVFDNIINVVSVEIERIELYEDIKKKAENVD